MAANAGGAAGAMAGKYGARGLNSAVEGAGDGYFDKKDQDLANETGATINRADGTVIRPQTGANSK